jgi:hypothetical protein
MSLLIADCPRCGSKRVTFDVTAQVFRSKQYGWANEYEVFSVCRVCHAPTIFYIRMTVDAYHKSDDLSKANALVTYTKALNDFFELVRYVSLRDHAQHVPPEFLENNILNAFKEGAACFSIACYNAAATMFRLCVDLATRPLLPDPSDEKIDQQTRERAVILDSAYNGCSISDCLTQL